MIKAKLSDLLKVHISLSKCAVCDKKKLRFIKAQEARGILSNLKTRTVYSKIPLIGDVLF